MRSERERDREMVLTNMGALTACCLVLLLWLSLCCAAPTLEREVRPSPAEEEAMAEKYLSQFFSNVGITNSTFRSINVNAFNESLEDMQAFFGLEMTGVLDQPTIDTMKAPRCGVSDISKYGHFDGRPKWRKPLLTYRITEYTRSLSQTQVDTTIAQAFKLYSDVIPLNFKQISSGTADIMILFKGGYHGDFHPFDGRSGVLAHANSPGLAQGGDTHFDDDENWTLNQRGVNLLLVAAHEFGHALGLDHSRVRSALMFPTYQYVNTNGYMLPDDDRDGVQDLYGSRTPKPKPNPSPEPEAEPEPEPEPEPEDPTEDTRPDPTNPSGERCSRDLVFDAATSIRGELYFFKSGYYWRKRNNNIQLTRVSAKWPQINHVDAACDVPRDRMVYFFEDQRYWALKAYTKRILPGYPKPLTDLGLPSSVTKVDAAITLSRKILLFVKNQYWSYDEMRNRMEPGYPRYIRQDFPGIGSKVDAVFANYGYVYFSNGPRQMEYYMPTKRVIRTLLNYGWLNCY